MKKRRFLRRLADRLDGAQFGTFRLVRRERDVEGSFDAAERGGTLGEHWSKATFLDPNAEANPAILRMIRARVRLEYNNNSYCRGIVNTVANYVVGTGPNLRLIPRTSASKAERRLLYDYANLFNDWFWDIQGARKLRVLCEAKIKDGEGFLLLTNRQKIGGIMLNFRPFEADLVTHNDLLGLDDGSPDGLVLDKFGEVEKFLILPKHPGGNLWSLSNDKPTPVDARYVCQWFTETRPGLLRGVSEIAPGLRMFAQLSRYTKAVVQNAENAAEINAVLKTQTPPAAGVAQIKPNNVFEIEHNAILSLPGGWEIQQLKPEQPSPQHDMFIRSLIREIGRSVGVPYAVAAADASGHNYSSMRGDWQGFHEEIKIRRNDCELMVLEKIKNEFDIEAQRVFAGFSRLPEHDYYWDWPGYEHVDPLKVANAQNVKLQNNTTTLAREFAKDGLFYEDEIEQRRYEQGLTKDLVFGKAPAQPVKEDDDDD